MAIREALPEKKSGFLTTNTGEQEQNVLSSMQFRLMEGQERSSTDQTLYMLRGVLSEPRLFVTYEHLHKTLYCILHTHNQAMNINTVYGKGLSRKALYAPP